MSFSLGLDYNKNETKGNEYTHITYIRYMSGTSIKILIVITVITVIFTSLIISFCTA